MFSLKLFAQLFLLCSMGRGVDWSLADVQFVRDGMAGGANMSLLARSRGWSYSSLEKLLRRLKQGESGSRKQRRLECMQTSWTMMEEDIQTNPRQSWPILAVKYECSRYTIRRKLSDRGFHTYKRCKTLKCKTVHHEALRSHAKNEMEMKAAVYTAWTKVDQNAVKRSIASWPKRLLLCIEKEGGCFEYARVKRAL